MNDPVAKAALSASAPSLMASNGNALYAAEARRLECEIVRAEGLDFADPMAAEPIFMSAQLIARQQGARAGVANRDQPRTPLGRRGTSRACGGAAGVGAVGFRGGVRDG